jgi:hypothetical protein
MTEQKKSASPDSLTQAGKDAKVELTEAQLKDVAGGALNAYLKADSSNKAQGNETVGSPGQTASLNFSLKIG